MPRRQGAGRNRAERAAHEAQQAQALAGELKILRKSDQTFEAFRITDPELRCGTEHLVEFDNAAGRVAKITVPPKFGLVPAVISTPQANLRDDPAIPRFRQEIGFIDASPLEYLERWMAANEVFEDDVRLTSVVEWADGRVSFAISQPQYPLRKPPDEIKRRRQRLETATATAEKIGAVLHLALLKLQHLTQNSVHSGDSYLPCSIQTSPEIEL